MNPALLRLLACPRCGHAVLGPDEESLTCRGCSTRYPVVDGMPSLVVPTGDARDAAWREQQERGRQIYENPDPEAKAYFDSVAREFDAFCAAEGLILDVGCGIESALAGVSQNGDQTYIGLDPLLPERAPSFPFVQGVAERLPFADGAFDWVLSATSFDHFPQPEQALAEIRRVLKQEGRFGIWLAVVDPDYLRRMHAEQFRLPSARDAATRAALLQLVRERHLRGLVSLAWRHVFVNRAGQIRAALLRRFREQDLLDRVFEDRAAYHHHFYRAEEFEELITRNGFTIERQRRIEDDAHGHSLFALALKKRA